MFLTAHPDIYDYLHGFQIDDNNNIKFIDGGGQSIKCEFRGKVDKKEEDDLVIFDMFFNKLETYKSIENIDIHIKRTARKEIGLWYFFNGYGLTYSEEKYIFDKNDDINYPVEFYVNIKYLDSLKNECKHLRKFSISSYKKENNYIEEDLRKEFSNIDVWDDVSSFQKKIIHYRLLYKDLYIEFINFLMENNNLVEPINESEDESDEE